MVYGLVLFENAGWLLRVELSSIERILLAFDRCNYRSAIWHITDCSKLEHAGETLVSVELIRVHAPVVRVVGHVMVFEKECFGSEPVIELSSCRVNHKLKSK